MSSAEAQKEASINKAIVANAHSLIHKIKDGRSRDSRAAMQCCVSVLCGDTVAENKMQKAITETLTINRDRIRSGMKHQKRVLNDTLEGWTVVKREKRNDATPEEHLKLGSKFKGMVKTLNVRIIKSFAYSPQHKERISALVVHGRKRSSLT